MEEIFDEHLDTQIDYEENSKQSQGLVKNQWFE